MLVSDCRVLPIKGSTFRVPTDLCVSSYCRALRSITGSDPVVIVYCVVRTFCLIQPYLLNISCSPRLCLSVCVRARVYARLSLSFTTLLCLPAVSVTTRSALFPLTSLIPWFKTPVVLPHFYASARISVTACCVPVQCWMTKSNSCRSSIHQANFPISDCFTTR